MPKNHLFMPTELIIIIFKKIKSVKESSVNLRKIKNEIESQEYIF